MRLTDKLVADIEETGPGTYREIACCTKRRLKVVAATLSNLKRKGRLVIMGRVKHGKGWPASIYGTPGQAKAHTTCRGLAKVFNARP